MYRKLMLAAATAAGVVATSFVAAPAEAAPYRVIRWEDPYCQARTTACRARGGLHRAQQEKEDP